MAPGEPEASGRSKRREETIARIVAGATRVLSTEGYEALTIQRLASELGYAVGALYRYFKSKDALLVAVVQRVLGELDSTTAHALAAVDAEGLAPADAALTRVIVTASAYVDLSERRPAEFGLLSSLTGDPRELLGTTDDAAPLMPSVMRLLFTVSSQFGAATAAGSLAPGDSALRTATWWASLQGVLQVRKLGRFGVVALRFDTLVVSTLSALLCGWGASAERVERLMPIARRIAAASAVATAPAAPEPVATVAGDDDDVEAESELG
jgi:AcrR family transcriptional regulator